MLTSTAALLAAILVAQLPSVAHAHGRLINPPSRMSAWRFGFDVPTNYNDHEQYCGGFANQWNVNGGKCGICGDPWQGPRNYERPNGRYVPKLVITKTYKAGATIDVDVEVTVNHLGWFEFRLCDVRKSGGVEATQGCLDQHLMADRRGKTRFDIGTRKGLIKFRLVLPPGLTCPQCVMQWKWHCANNVGYGEKQEEFYACSDVTITASGATQPPTITQRPIYTPRPPVVVTQRPTNPPIVITQRPTNPPVIITQRPTNRPIYVTNPPIYVTNPPTNPPIFVTITSPPRVTLPPYLLIRLGDKTRPLAERIQEYTQFQQTHISNYKIWDAGHLTFKPRYDPRLAANILRRENNVAGVGTNVNGNNNNYINNNNNNNGYPYDNNNNNNNYVNNNNAIGSNYGNTHNNNNNGYAPGTNNNNNGGVLGSNYGNTRNNYNNNYNNNGNLYRRISKRFASYGDLHVKMPNDTISLNDNYSNSNGNVVGNNQNIFNGVNNNNKNTNRFHNNHGNVHPNYNNVHNRFNDYNNYKNTNGNVVGDNQNIFNGVNHNNNGNVGRNNNDNNNYNNENNNSNGNVVGDNWNIFNGFDDGKHNGNTHGSGNSFNNNHNGNVGRNNHHGHNSFNDNNNYNSNGNVVGDNQNIFNGFVDDNKNNHHGNAGRNNHHNVHNRFNNNNSNGNVVGDNQNITNGVINNKNNNNSNA